MILTYLTWKAISGKSWTESRSKPKIEGDIPKARWDAGLIFVNTEMILLGGNLKEED